MNFTVKRSKGVAIYLGLDDSGIESKDGATLNFSNTDQWESIKRFDEGYGYVGIVQLDNPKLGRYLAVVRGPGKENIVNLKEVEIYHKPSEYYTET